MESVERHVTLPTDLDEAWGLLTRPEELAAWLGDEVALDPTPGAAGRVVERDGTERHLVVDQVDPGRRLSWRWWTIADGSPSDGRGDPTETSQVEITLTPTDGGTLVRVVEHLVAPAGQAPPRARASAPAGTGAGAAWSHRLLHLEALLLVAAAVRG